MFLIFDNSEILNLNNVVYIKAKNYSDEVRITIATTAITYFWTDRMLAPGYDYFSKEFIIEKEKWFELLEAIKNDKKVFVL